jgi:hypothetical protein
MPKVPVPGWPRYTYDTETGEILSIWGTPPTPRSDTTFRMWKDGGKNSRSFTAAEIRRAVEAGEPPVPNQIGGSRKKHDITATEHRDATVRVLRAPTPGINAMFDEVGRDARMCPCL